jgi:hypothetical protein
LALARQEAQISLQPSLQANARATAQAVEDARNQAAAARAGYAALANVQAGIAPQIEQTYGTAADRQAAYGKGFSGQVGGLLDKSAADANALLAANGSPQQIASQGGSARDVLYALGGYNPASVLNAQGAAFGSAARNLPGMSVGLGVDAAKAANAAGAKNALDLRNQAADLQARRPGLLSQALSGIQQNQGNAYSQFIQGQYLANSLRQTGAGITGVDPATNQPTFAAQTAAQEAAAKKAATRAAAVTKRNDATVEALAGAQDWVQARLAPGVQQQKVGDQPIKVGSSKVGKATISIWATKDGKTVTSLAPPPNVATKPIYAQIPIPKPQYNQIIKQVTGKLTTQLRRYGYKPAQIRAFALDVVDDYYVLTTDLPPLPPQKRTEKNDSGGTTTTTGP